MTSKQQSITSMISVVAEGRCALLASYQIFQFIVGYAMAQAFATNLMYTHALQMGNYQYLIGVSGHWCALQQRGCRVES
jgi:magnesium-transporting ATPase (P-type)